MKSTRRLFISQMDWKKMIVSSRMAGLIVLLLLIPSAVNANEEPIDYPMLKSIPDTQFSCRGRLPGYYADPHPAARCQVYHMCNQLERLYSYLCPNYTLFHQERLICDHWYRVNCSQAESFYVVNENIYEESLLRSRNKQLLQKPAYLTSAFPFTSAPPANIKVTSSQLLYVREGVALPVSRRPITISRQRSSVPNQIPTTVTKVFTRPPSQVRNDATLGLTTKFASLRVTTVRPSTGVIQPIRIVRPVNNCLGCLPYYFTDPLTCTPCVRPR